MGMTKYYIDQNGNYIGGFDGSEPPVGAIEIPSAPSDARQKWSGQGWGSPIIPPPDRVSSRQFKMQLEIDGLLGTVEGWVASKPKLTQIAYENSGTFLRTDPMMAEGFTALGFNSARIDKFFSDAALL